MRLEWSIGDNVIRKCIFSKQFMTRLNSGKSPGIQPIYDKEIKLD